MIFENHDIPLQDKLSARQIIEGLGNTVNPTFPSLQKHISKLQPQENIDLTILFGDSEAWSVTTGYYELANDVVELITIYKRHSKVPYKKVQTYKIHQTL